MMQNLVSSQLAPCAIGPYSQAIIASGTHMLFISGQIPLNPQTMKVESSDIREQTRRVLSNIGAILKEAKVDKNTIVKTTVYLKNMEDFSLVNEEYEGFFLKHKPARVCVEVARLPKDALVEIDAIAIF
jgi:2-iminobutanoate/2-iminopropanoate deaminase